MSREALLKFDAFGTCPLFQMVAVDRDFDAFERILPLLTKDDLMTVSPCGDTLVDMMTTDFSAAEWQRVLPHIPHELLICADRHGTRPLEYLMLYHVDSAVVFTEYLSDAELDEHSFRHLFEWNSKSQPNNPLLPILLARVSISVMLATIKTCKTQKPEIVKIYEKRPQFSRGVLRKALGLLPSDVARTYALIVAISDDMLKVRRYTPTKIVRFFSISSRLPLEIQAMLANRLHDQVNLFIPQKEVDPALRWSLN